jgi:hypothetical protein
MQGPRDASAGPVNEHWVEYVVPRLLRHIGHPSWQTLEPAHWEQVAIGHRTMVGTCTRSGMEESYKVRPYYGACYGVF